MVKKKQNYDFAFNYMEEVYFPTIKQKWLLLHTDPVWYRFILGGIVAEALIILFMTPFQIQMFSHYHLFFTRIQQIFNFMYILDIILTFNQKFFFPHRYPYPNPIRRPALVMIMEIVSVLPFELIFTRNVTIKTEYSYNDRRFYTGLITLHILKLARFFYHVYNNRRDLHNTFVTRLLEMIIILVVFCGFTVHLLHILEYLVTYEEIYDGFQLISCNVAGRGSVLNDVRINDFSVYKFEIAASILAIVMWTIAVYPTTCFMIMSFTENQQHKHDYCHLIHLFKKKISVKYNLSGEKYQMMMDYFQANWKLRGGFARLKFDFSQKSLDVEIAMDTYWPAFKHSMLFRHAEFYILRALADKFERRIRMEGEYIFSKNKKKLGLIYIVQGVIEVLSAENNESGILSLTAGSCIGEASLIIPHNSSANFRCKSVCELFELPRDKFMIFQKSYQIEYKQLQIKLNEVLAKVRKIREYNSKFNQRDVERNRLIWLKYQLHNMMSHRSSYKNTHEQTNVYLRHELHACVKSQKHIFHTFEYLDKLAIRERTFTDVDLVFIRNTCPWILKAGSPITNLWEYLIVLMAVCCSLAVSYGVCINYNDTIRLITSACHVFFIFDIVVQVITPVYPESDARTVAAVLSERLKTKGFFMDIVSIYYWEMIAFVFDTKLPWYELFKLVKLWRVWKFFETWTNRFLLNLIIFTVSVGFATYIALIYAMSCVFTLSKITKNLMSALTIQFATGAGLPFKSDSATNNYVFVFANGLSLVIQLGVTAMVCSSFYLQHIAQAKIITIIHVLNKWVKYKESKWLWIRLHAYFNVLQHESDVLLSQGNVTRVFELPRYFEIMMKSNVHFEALKRLQLFKHLPDELITNLLVNTEFFTLYQHSIIVSRGVIYKEVFVLIEGECRTLINGTYLKTKPYEALNLLENCYNSPAVTSTVSLTDCLVLKFNYEAFLHLLCEHNLNYKIFRKTVQITKEENQKGLMKLLYDPIMLVRSKNKNPNFKRFLFFAPKDSYEESDYHVPFDKIRPFDFVKFLLMRTTFYPEGNFIKCYEMIRCTVAFMSACAFTIPAINVGAYTRRSTGYPVMLALDLFALLDIYIRMHVGYYTSDGILVTHPLRTAKYYMTHGFFIDFIAVFPFDIFPMKVQYRVVLNAIHALQLHRIAALRKYYSTNHRYYILNTISIVCYIVFAANFIAGMIFVYDCYSWDTEEQVPNATCRIFQYEKTEAHFHILFLVTSALECSGISGKINVADLDTFLTMVICFLTIFGVLTKILHKAYIFSSYITRIIEKYEYIVGVRRLMRLISQRSRNSRYLCKEVSNYYDLHWARVASQNMSLITQDMISALRRDMLFKFYGDNLVTYSVFTHNIRDTTLFIKNIFLVAKPMVMPKNGYAATINDVDKFIYLLNNGSVDVLAPDGSKILELTAGAMFGNFSGDTYTRLKVSLVANVNTDLVYVTGADFFNIIAYFPNINTLCEAIIKRNIYYIPSTKPAEPHLKMTFEEYVKAVHKYSFFQIINSIHLFYVCYLGICMELYQLAVGEMHIIYLAVQYSMDLMHVIREYLKFCMPYKDDHGAPIFSTKKIVARQVANRTELYIMIITVIYLDLFLVIPVLLLGRYQLSNLTWYVTILRLNRLLRIYYINASYHQNQLRPSQSLSNMVKWFYVIYWYILSYQMVAASTAILDFLTSGTSSNLIRNVSVDKIKNIRHLDSKEKFEMYARYFFFANLIHVNTNDKHYGPTNTTFNVYIIMLFMYHLIIDSVLLCKFFEAMIDIAVLRRLYLNASSALKFYMRKSSGTFTVKDRVMENAKHAWTKNYYKSDHLMDVVCAKYLKEVIVNDLYGYLLRRHPVLSHTHLDFLRQLGVHMKRVIYPCNFVIVYKKEVRKCMFFVHKGKVTVYDVDFGYHDIALAELKKGDSFGFVQGLGPLRALYEFTYIASTHCEIIELEWDAWNYLLPFFPASNEYIFEEAEKYAGEAMFKLLPKEIKKEYW